MKKRKLVFPYVVKHAIILSWNGVDERIIKYPCHRRKGRRQRSIETEIYIYVYT